MPPSNSPCSEFLEALLRRCGTYQDTACLTLTAIHPDGQHRTPSRHIPLHQPDQLQNALQRLLEANRLGWGAYFAVGLRQPGLTRWRRGGTADILALPALFLDLDDPSATALARLQTFTLPPSCIVDSGGGGYHAYWWLDAPTTDLDHAGRLLKALAQHLDGDKTSVAASLRLPWSINTKPKRGGLCRIIALNDRCYSLSAFADLLPIDDLRFQKREKPYITRQTVHTVHGRRLNPALIAAVEASLYRDYSGYRKDNGYLAALCPCGHAHDAPGKHFNFDPVHGVGLCFGRHGRLLLHDLCQLLGIQPADYGGIFVNVLAQPTCLDKKVEMIR